MRQSRNINIIVDAGGNRLVLINDILFKGKVEETKKKNMIKMLNMDGIDMMCDLRFLFMRMMC